MNESFYKFVNKKGEIRFGLVVKELGDCTHVYRKEKKTNYSSLEDFVSKFNLKSQIKEPWKVFLWLVGLTLSTFLDHNFYNEDSLSYLEKMMVGIINMKKEIQLKLICLVK